MTGIVPAPTVSVEVSGPDGWVGVRVEHPPGVACVFIDGQCSCGLMDLGVVPGLSEPAEEAP